MARRIYAERRKSEIELEMAGGVWLDPRRGDVLLRVWVGEWLPTRHDLRATTWARLETTMNQLVLPRFGEMPMRKITNGEVRRWVLELLASGLSAATTRKAVFGLRQALDAAIADGRLAHNAAAAVPLPPERQKPPRFLSQPEVERLMEEFPDRDRALVLVGAYAGLRWGEAAGLRRRDVDPLRSRIRVSGTAVQLRGEMSERPASAPLGRPTQLEPEVVADIERLRRTKKWSARLIAIELNDRGHRVSVATISRWLVRLGLN